MPTYEYQCKKCGHQFEHFQSIKDKPLKNCMQSGCDGSVYRIISAGAGILFKGTGFYQTDYRSESYKNAAKADKESTAAGASTDSKTAGSTKDTGNAAGAKTSSPAKE